jgi:hypothetical protein
MPTNTKFTQRNDAAGKMTGSQVAMGVATGRMSAKDVANAMGKPTKSTATPAKPSAPTKSNATKTTGSYKKPTTPPTKTQNIPEVTVSVTKKKVTGVKPVPTTPAKEKGVLDTNVYIIRDPQNEYAYREVKRGTKGAQALNPSRYEKMKGGIGPMKNN